MARLLAVCLAVGTALAGVAWGEAPPQFPPTASTPCGEVKVTYSPARLMTCKNGHCWWHDPAPAQAYQFTDPVFCFGANCPPGTLGQGGKVR